jgi:hypothetical protein
MNFTTSMFKALRASIIDGDPARALDPAEHLGEYKSEAAVFTRRPVPEDATDPIVIINPPIAITDEAAAGVGGHGGGLWPQGHAWQRRRSDANRRGNRRSDLSAFPPPKIFAVTRRLFCHRCDRRWAGPGAGR